MFLLLSLITAIAIAVTVLSMSYMVEDSKLFNLKTVTFLEF